MTTSRGLRIFGSAIAITIFLLCIRSSNAWVSAGAALAGVVILRIGAGRGFERAKFHGIATVGDLIRRMD